MTHTVRYRPYHTLSMVVPPNSISWLRHCNRCTPTIWRRLGAVQDGQVSWLRGGTRRRLPVPHSVNNDQSLERLEFQSRVLEAVDHARAPSTSVLQALKLNARSSETRMISRVIYQVLTTLQGFLANAKNSLGPAPGALA